jgi:hypothetical protein
MTRNLVLGSLLALFATFAAAQLSAQTKQRVRFARGASSSTVKGTVRGYAYRDYVIGASAGQTVDVRLTSPDTFSVFTIFMPNGDNLEGATQMDEFGGELPVSGDYVIRVGMMRAEARRRGSVSNYSLTVSIK